MDEKEMIGEKPRVAGPGSILFLVLVLGIVVFGAVFNLASHTGMATASNGGSDLTITNLRIERNDNTIQPTFENITFMEWIISSNSKIFLSDFVDVSSQYGIGGVIGIVDVITGNPKFTTEVQGVPYFTEHKEFKLTAINQASPSLAEKLAPPNFIAKNGYIVSSSIGYNLNTTLLPFYPGDKQWQGNVLNQQGAFAGLPTYQSLVFDMELSPGTEIYFYFLACNHVCRITKLKHVKIKKISSSDEGGGSPTRGLPCLYSSQLIHEGPCVNGKKVVTYQIIGNRPPEFCPPSEKTVVEACTEEQKPSWPVKRTVSTRKPIPPPKPQPKQEPGLFPPEQTRPVPVIPDSYIPIKQNCMNIPSFFGNVKACWESMR